MNAPMPAVVQRDTPQALLLALAERFEKQFSQAMAVREQHGRDESAFTCATARVRGICPKHHRCSGCGAPRG